MVNLALKGKFSTREAHEIPVYKHMRNNSSYAWEKEGKPEKGISSRGYLNANDIILDTHFQFLSQGSFKGSQSRE